MCPEFPGVTGAVQPGSLSSNSIKGGNGDDRLSVARLSRQALSGKRGSLKPRTRHPVWGACLLMRNSDYGMRD